MATVSNPFSPKDQQEEEEQNNQNQPAASQSVVGGESANIGAAPTGANAPQAGQPSTSGRFTNLQKYISANKDFKSNQGGLGGQIASNINKEGQNVQKQAGQAVDTFKTQANAAADAFRDFNAPLPTRGSPPLIAQPTSALQAATTAPNQLSAEQKNKVIAMRDAQYTGPKSLQDLSGEQNLANLENKAENVKGMVTQAGSEGGRFNLLRQMFGKSGYNQGQQKLDNLIIQGQGDQLNKLSSTRRSALDTQKGIQDANVQAIDQAKGFTTEADQVRQKTVKSLSDAVTQRNQAIQDRVAQAQNTYNQELQQFGAGSLTDQQLQELGLSAGQRLYGLNLKDVVGQGETANVGNVASADEFSQMKALNELGGGKLSQDALNNLLQYGSADQAGKFNANDIKSALKYSPENLRQLISGKQAEVQNSDPWKSSQQRAQEAATGLGYISNVDSALQNYQRDIGGIRNEISSVQGRLASADPSYVSAMQSNNAADPARRNQIEREYVNNMLAVYENTPERDRPAQYNDLLKLKQLQDRESAATAGLMGAITDNTRGQGYDLSTRLGGLVRSPNGGFNSDAALPGIQSAIAASRAYESQKQAAAQAALEQLMGQSIKRR